MPAYSGLYRYVSSTFLNKSWGHKLSSLLKKEWEGTKSYVQIVVLN